MKTNVQNEPKLRLSRKPFILKSFLVLFFSLGILSSTFATDYYFSSSAGDDNRSATQAQSSATPWRSIDKLNSIADQLKGGDRILFKSGDVFYGNILVTRGGGAGNPITFTSYGTGAKPVITSLTRVTNWVSRGNGIYEAGIDNITGSVQIFTIDDQLKEVGRYPNVDAANDGYLTIAGVNNNLSIQGQNMPSNYVGGEIVIRKNNWIIDRHEISYNSGGTISFLANQTTIYSPQAGFGYFVQNHVNTLDQFGEWAYSKSEKRLYGYFGGQNPNDLNVQVATRDHLIDVSKYIQNITFNNLSLKGANANLLNVQNSANIQVTNCQLKFAGQNAMYAHTTPDILFRNNEVDYSLSGGLFFQFSTPRTIIEGNVINHTMPFQGMANSSDLKGEAIYIPADANNSLVSKNRIYNTGFNGIHFGGNYTIIKNNLIDTYCLHKQDGGGIYTNSDGLTTMNNVGREIIGNIVLRGMGAVGGSNINYKLAEGIYIDDNSMGVKIADNTVADISGKGLYIHNNRNIEIYNNLFHNIPIQLHISHDVFGDAVRNVTVQNNLFSSIQAEELPYSISSLDNDINQVGTSNNNYFLDPYGVELMFKSQSPNDGALGQKMSMAAWTKAYGYESSSVKPDFGLEKYVITESSIVKESDFSSGIGIIAGTYNVVADLASGITGGVLKIGANQSTNGSAFIQIGAVSPGDEFLIEFDTKSGTVDQTIEVLLEKTFNQNQEGNIYNFVTSADVKRVKLLMKANVGSSSESIVFRFPKTLQGLLIDNLVISKVKTEPINVDEQIFFQYNYSDNVVSYPLSGTYKNAKGEVFTSSVTIPAYRSVLLVKTEAGEDVPLPQPTISITEPAQNQEFTLGEEILLNATVSTPAEQVQKVEFYVNEVLVSTSVKIPFQFNLTNAKLGSNVLKAKVYDVAGQTAESEPVTILVKELEVVERPTQNLAPQIAITSPTLSQSYVTGQEVLIRANVSDPENKISRVEFFNGETMLGAVTATPYEFSWKNAPVGSHELKAKVFDAGGLTAESTRITIGVKAATVPNQTPSISMTSPVQNQNFIAGQEVLIKANATDPEGKISRVEFFYGETMLGTSTVAPYQFSWKNAPVGTHVLKAKVFDAGGLTAESARITIGVKAATVPNQAPSISIASPVQNQSFVAGQEVLIKANATDPESKISRVEFFYGETMLGTSTVAPYQFSWKNAPVGTHVLKAKVFDAGGLTAESARVTVVVKAALIANLAPSVSIATPLRSQSFVQGQDIVFAANAKDPENKIAWVEFYYGETMIGLVSSAPYQVVWKNAPVGSHILKTKVFDQEGLTAESSRISISVKAVTVQNQAPSISIATPVQRQSFVQGQDIVFAANAKDPENKIAWVEFYYGETMIGLVTSAPYQVVWKNAPVGSHILKAKVFDQEGLTAESSRISVSVKAVTAVNQAPSIAITSPTTSQTIYQGDAVVFAADAKDPENKVAWVEFYYGETMLGMDSNAPYELSLKGVPAGEYVLKAKVFDSEGLSAESARRTVRVLSNIAFRKEEIELISPANDQLIQSAETVNVEIAEGALGNDYDSLAVFVDEVKVGITDNSKFDLDVSSMSPGENKITVKGYQEGKELSSDQVSVNVIEDSIQRKAGTSNGEQPYTFEIGPNPTSDVLNIYLEKMYQDEDIEIHVYSVEGVMLNSVETNTSVGKVTLDISSYSAGVYFIRIQGKVFMYDTKRFIKN